MMIIDSHVRLALPDSEMGAYERFLEYHGVPRGYESGERLIADMDQDGVDISILLQGANEHRLALMERYPKRLIAFAGVRMEALTSDPETALTSIRQYIVRGCLGIGEVSMINQSYGVDNPALHALIELAIELDVPIHFDCTSTIGEAHPGRMSILLYDFERLAVLYPKLKIILNSWGGGLCLFEMMPELPETFENVYYSTASPVDNYDIGIMMRTVPKVCHPRKVLYGSAAPLCSRKLEKYMDADAPTEVIQAVMGSNTAALLGIDIHQGVLR